ncbi:MAG: hypothetical protein Q8Q42_02155 [Nanoarchaeota archaeon]|nr:hypothetical protein [Nanoarchaeota archaeon]
MMKGSTPELITNKGLEPLHLNLILETMQVLIAVMKFCVFTLLLLICI